MSLATLGAAVSSVTRAKRLKTKPCGIGTGKKLTPGHRWTLLDPVGSSGGFPEGPKLSSWGSRVRTLVGRVRTLVGRYPGAFGIYIYIHHTWILWALWVMKSKQIAFLFRPRLPNFCLSTSSMPRPPGKLSWASRRRRRLQHFPARHSGAR